MIFKGMLDESGRFIPDDRPAWNAHRHALSGYAVEVDMWKHRAKRSLQQNRWMHAFLRPLAEAAGETVPRIKLLGLVNVFGVDKIGDTFIPVKSSTTECNTEEMGDLCEWFVQYAAEHYGLMILYPDEFKAAKKKRQQGRRSAGDHVSRDPRGFVVRHEDRGDVQSSAAPQDGGR